MRFCLLILMIVFCNISLAQQVADLEENKPYEYNGLQYGYFISNEGTKEVKGEDYDRYEIDLFVTNNSGCLKLIPIKSGWTGNISASEQEAAMIAEFYCTNATGKRLTAKKGTVSAKPYYATARIPDEYSRDRYRTVSAQIGFAIRTGQTITSRIIVIVPRGEKPVFNCRMVYFPEMQ